MANTSTFIIPNTEGSSHDVDGWYTTKNVLGKAGIDCSIIHATNHRGRISIMYASFEVAKVDRSYLFKHMGHSEHVNVGTYQRPLPVVAMMKVGAVLANISASIAVQKTTKPQGNAANTIFDKLCSPKSSQTCYDNYLQRHNSALQTSHIFLLNNDHILSIHSITHF